MEVSNTEVTPQHQKAFGKKALAVVFNHKKLSLLLIALVLIGAGSEVWLHNRDRVTTHTVNGLKIKKYGHTIEINGEKADTAFYDSLPKSPTPTTNPASKSQPSIDPIAQYEFKVANGNATTDDLMILAQLYEQVAHDNDKAIATYEKVKQIADPKAPGYANLIQTVDAQISRLKAAAK